MSHLYSSHSYYPKWHLAQYPSFPKKIQKHFYVFKCQILSLLSGLSNFQQDIFEIAPFQVLIYLNIIKISFLTSGKIPQASCASIHLLLWAIPRITGPFTQERNKPIPFWTWSSRCFGPVLILITLAVSSVPSFKRAGRMHRHRFPYLGEIKHWFHEQSAVVWSRLKRTAHFCGLSSFITQMGDPVRNSFQAGVQPFISWQQVSQLYEKELI